MHVAGDGHFHLEPQSHVTPETSPILEGKVLLGLAVHRAVSCQHLGWGGLRGELLGEEMGPKALLQALPDEVGGSRQVLEAQSYHSHRLESGPGS